MLIQQNDPSGSACVHKNLTSARNGQFGQTLIYSTMPLQIRQSAARAVIQLSIIQVARSNCLASMNWPLKGFGTEQFYALTARFHQPIVHSHLSKISATEPYVPVELAACRRKWAGSPRPVMLMAKPQLLKVFNHANDHAVIETLDKLGCAG
jgi:hypothetical protein